MRAAKVIAPVLGVLLLAFPATALTVDDQIAELLRQIAALQAQLAQLKGQPGSGASCVTLVNNMGPDDSDADVSGEVSKLQQFLATDPSIYPEGRITGYFGPATTRAVQRWQSSHGVVSSGDPDSTGYGFVGPKTRAAMARSCNGQTPQIPGRPETPAQVQVQEITYGTGKEATSGSTVSVMYIGKLPDGTVFDSTASHGNQPLQFTLGSQGLMQGFQMGVTGMKEGGERLVSIPPSLAYGSQEVKDGSGKVIIPANSTLIFDITLVKVGNDSVLDSPEQARMKSRDARRVADIKQLQLALELYYDSKNQYPATLAPLKSAYISTIPTDPKTGASYQYAGLGSGQCTGYHLGATLETVTSSALQSDKDAAPLPICSGSAADFSGADPLYDVQEGANGGTLQTFTASPTSGPAPLTVSFQAYPLDGPYYYLDYGNGRTLGASALYGACGGRMCDATSMPYESAGTYTAKLIELYPHGCEKCNERVVGSATITVTGIKQTGSIDAASLLWTSGVGTISGLAQDSDNIIDVVVRDSNGGLLFESGAIVTNGRWSASNVVPIPNGTYPVRVYADSTNNTLLASGTLSVNISGTLITVLAPNGGETFAWGPGKSITIRYKITGAPGNGTVCTQLYDANGAGYSFPNGGDANCKSAINGEGSVTANYEITNPALPLPLGTYRAGAYVTIPPNGLQVADDKSDGTFSIVAPSSPPQISILQDSMEWPINMTIVYAGLPPQTTSALVNKDTGALFGALAIQFYEGGTGTKNVTIEKWQNLPAGNYILRAYDWNWSKVIAESTGYITVAK